jgi:hypothetical protein
MPEFPLVGLRSKTSLGEWLALNEACLLDFNVLLLRIERFAGF